MRNRIELSLVCLSSVALGYTLAWMLGGKEFTPLVGAIFALSGAIVARWMLMED